MTQITGLEAKSWRSFFNKCQKSCNPKMNFSVLCKVGIPFFDAYKVGLDPKDFMGSVLTAFDADVDERQRWAMIYNTITKKGES